MPKPSLDKATKKALLEACRLVEANAKADGNEAETRKRTDRILETLMGYDIFKHLTSEYQIRGAGDAVYCDIAQSRPATKSHQNLILSLKLKE